MKNLYHFSLLAIVSIVSLSCSKDEDSHVPESGEDIYGEWKLVEYTSQFTTTSQFGPSQDVTMIEEEFQSEDAVLILNKDNSFNVEGSIQRIQSTTLNGETKTEEFEQDYAHSGTYELEGDKIVFNASGSEIVIAGEFKLSLNSGSKLEFLSNETGTTTENGFEIEWTRTEEYKFER